MLKLESTDYADSHRFFKTGCSIIRSKQTENPRDATWNRGERFAHRKSAFICKICGSCSNWNPQITQTHTDFLKLDVQSFDPNKPRIRATQRGTAARDLRTENLRSSAKSVDHAQIGIHRLRRLTQIFKTGCSIIRSKQTENPRDATWNRGERFAHRKSAFICVQLRNLWIVFFLNRAVLSPNHVTLGRYSLATR